MENESFSASCSDMIKALLDAADMQFGSA